MLCLLCCVLLHASHPIVAFSVFALCSRFPTAIVSLLSDVLDLIAHEKHCSNISIYYYYFV